MKHLTNKLKLLFSLQNNTLLGRWSKLKSIEELNRRIYLANIDNCGTCKFEKKNNNIFNINKHKIN